MSFASGNKNVLRYIEWTLPSLSVSSLPLHFFLEWPDSRMILMFGSAVLLTSGVIYVFDKRLKPVIYSLAVFFGHVLCST